MVIYIFYYFHRIWFDSKSFRRIDLTLSIVEIPFSYVDDPKTVGGNMPLDIFYCFRRRGSTLYFCMQPNSSLFAERTPINLTGIWLSDIDARRMHSHTLPDFPLTNSITILSPLMYMNAFCVRSDKDNRVRIINVVSVNRKVLIRRFLENIFPCSTCWKNSDKSYRIMVIWHWCRHKLFIYTTWFSAFQFYHDFITIVNIDAFCMQSMSVYGQLYKICRCRIGKWKRAIKKNLKKIFFPTQLTDTTPTTTTLTGLWLSDIDACIQIYWVFFYLLIRLLFCGDSAYRCIVK